ncbi:MAG: shikimate dehydrogenase family protein [Candidatus Eiseniibacteriota bacterium]
MKFLVVGSPIAHSLSPAMMGAAFRSLDFVEVTYEAREIRREEWPAKMADLFREGIEGVNVTVPLKELTLDGARHVNPTAKSIGAANFMIRMPGGWRVDNTDGGGFQRWIISLHAGKLTRSECLILGAGGSARAVAWGLRDCGCPRIRVANRTLARAEALTRRWQHPEVVAERLEEAKAPAGGLVVNCTALGLRPGDPPPISEEQLAGAGLVLDLVYPETPLVKMARAMGIPVHDGIGMLVQQGCFSVELWTGERPDIDLMQQACLDELARRAH